MSSVICFNLDQSEILSSGNGLIQNGPDSRICCVKVKTYLSVKQVGFL